MGEPRHNDPGEEGFVTRSRQKYYIIPFLFIHDFVNRISSTVGEIKSIKPENPTFT